MFCPLLAIWLDDVRVANSSLSADYRGQVERKGRLLVLVRVEYQSQLL